MRSRRDRFRAFRRGVIGVGTFIYAWGIAGVVPIRLPFELPALPAIALPSLTWSLRAPAESSFSSTSAVPEPGYWILMIAGALMVGAALRSHPRRRLQPAY
jgi:hypothetical protein